MAICSCDGDVWGLYKGFWGRKGGVGGFRLGFVPFGEVGGVQLGFVPFGGWEG